MKKHSTLKSLLLLTSFLAFFGSARASLVNGDFETGNLSGWSLFTTSNGTMGPSPLAQVTLFDVDGDSVLSHAASMSVGYATAPCSSPGVSCPQPTEGGGLRQNVYFTGGLFSLSAQVAVQNTFLYGGYNLDGGLFSFILDGTTLDTFSVGRIKAGSTQRGLLSYSGFIGEGFHTLDLLVTRNYASSQSLFQYVDNVSAKEIPEPGTLLLVAIALLSFPIIRRIGRV